MGRLGIRSLQHVEVGTCGFSAPASEMSSPLLIQLNRQLVNQLAT